MITTLLFDIDNTLLTNDMSQFLPVYFRALTRFLAPYAAPEAVGAGLMAGTQAMAANLDPRRTLQQVFNEQFQAATGINLTDLKPQVEQFYAEQFPALRAGTETRPAYPRSAARRILQWAAERGLHLGIISVPMLPRAAHAQRLAWAGVPESDFPYVVLRGMETARFSKPHPEFFAQILAGLSVTTDGAAPGEVLVVGDSWNDDILPAAALGMHTFWVNDRTTAPDGGPAYWRAAGSPSDGATPAPDVRPAGQGGLEDLERWLADGGLESLPPAEPPATPRCLLAMLAGHLAVVLEMLEGCPGQVDWHARPTPDEWSLAEILCHLRDVETEVHTDRFRRMIRESNPYIVGIDADLWAAERDYQQQDGPAALAAFAAARAYNLDRLRAQPPEVWARPARHSILGPSTFAEIVRLSVQHDQLHLRQISATLRQIADHR